MVDCHANRQGHLPLTELRHGRAAPMARAARGMSASCFRAAILAALWLVAPGCDRLLAQSDDRRSANLEQAAVTAQNRGDYAAATTFWRQWLTEFPDHARRGEALHNSGLCHAKLGQYAEAVAQLQDALSALDREAVESRARAHLYLGFSHLELGKQLAATESSSSQRHFQSAVDVLNQMLEQFPNYVANHEAYFFLGSAHEQRQQYEQAAKAYERLVANPQATFYLDGLFALGYAWEQLQRYEEARQQYQRYLNEGGDHPSMDEARLRIGEVAWQLAKAHGQSGDVAQQEAYLREASEHLSAVAAKPEFAMRDAAIFRLAWMAFQAGSWQQAGDLFASVAELPNSVLASPAALLAGRAALQDQSWDHAARWLQRVLEAKNELSVEAAHWMAQLELRRGQPESAFALADSWLPRAESTPWQVELLMDRAEAAAALPARQADSVAHYLEVTAADPAHRLAPVALYQAAFTRLERGERDQAIALCQRFQKEYAQHDYLPDVLEVWADAALTAERYDEARQVFDQLVQFEDHDKRAHWSMRRGVAAFFQRRFDEAESILSQAARQAERDPIVAAEAYYWLGCTQLERGQPQSASQSFERVLASQPQGPREVEALLFLVQSHLAQDDLAAAERTAQSLWQDHPQTAQAAEAAYRVALRADHDAAVSWLRALIERFPQSPLAAPSWYALGRRLHDHGDRQAALTAFQQLFDLHPDYEGMVAARIEAASIHRQLNQPADARQALLDVTAELPRDHARWFDAHYELALAEVASGDREASIMRLEMILADPRGAEHADRVHYEIAWAARDGAEALRARDESANSAEITRLDELAHRHFTAITREFPHSAVAADAWFQLAQQHYAQGDYAPARDAYRSSLAAANEADPLRERAWYKLGWSLFRLGEFVESQRAFEQQVQAFPRGKLHADGLFMVSETLFARKEYEQALQAYRTAKPVIDESESVAEENRWFAALHAAQAANQTKQFDEALEFSRQLASDPSAPDSLRLDAWLEMGNAYLGLKKMPEAVEAWQRASADLGQTGVRAACMIGDALFAQKKFDEAIQQFKLVLYGYGGLERNPEVDAWKAFAAYETARCFHVQVADAPPELKPRLLQQSIEFFQYLVDHYPDSDLASEARSQLEKLRRL